MRRNALVATLAVLVGLPLVVSFSGCARPDLPQASTTGASHLFVWAGDADEEDSDFLAVIDARRSEPTYGQVVATLPVGARATMPHHTEYEYPSNDILFVNGWVAGRTFLIDLRNPLEPQLSGQFTSVEAPKATIRETGGLSPSPTSGGRCGWCIGRCRGSGY